LEYYIMSYTRIDCECGLFGNKTEAEVKEVIRIKATVMGQRFWAYVKCPISGLFHAFDGARYTAEDYKKGIQDGSLGRKIALAKEREATEQKDRAPLVSYSAFPSPPVSASLEAPSPPPAQEPKEEARTPQEICQSKTGYASETTASMALSQCRAKGRPEIRYYSCQFCKKLHLTSQPAKSTAHYKEVARYPMSDPGCYLLIEKVWESQEEKTPFAGIAVTRVCPNTGTGGITINRIRISRDMFGEFIEGVISATLDNEEETTINNEVQL
jgi:hypothetical protein